MSKQLWKQLLVPQVKPSDDSIHQAQNPPLRPRPETSSNWQLATKIHQKKIYDIGCLYLKTAIKHTVWQQRDTAFSTKWKCTICRSKEKCWLCATGFLCVPQNNLELTMQPRLTLNSWQLSHLSPHSAGITSVSDPALRTQLTFSHSKYFCFDVFLLLLSIVCI